MDCQACYIAHPDGARFCMGCGAALSVACAACQHPNPAAARFCLQCGSALAGPERAGPAPHTYTPRHLAEKILTARHTLAGERKQITVLFADVVGSTALIRDLDTEDAQRLLDGAVRIMMDAVHQYEGTVSRALGDGIMALFGAPIAHEDHALRACYAALAMQSAMRRYAEGVRARYDVEIEIRVGLNSGEVVVRLVSDDLHMDYTAMGQTVHVASRMERLAGAGTTRLTADTLALVGGQVQVDHIGLIAVKGLAAPIDVFELIGAGATRTRLQASAVRGLTRFIGRDAELVALLVAQARVQEGAGQVVAVVGQPGIGKSRLIYEFVHSPSITGWRILESSSVSYAQATPYLPVVDLLKSCCQVEERDDIQTVREKLTRAVLTSDPALESSLPALLSLLDVPVDEAVWQALDPPRRRERTLAACRQLLLAESARQPLVIVIENLHWVDSETQALLDSLVEGLAVARILLVVSFRPEYRHSWGTRSSYTQIQLDALRPERASELLEALVGHDPSMRTLSKQLVQRTEGNPFFLEECVRTLLETGALVGERGAYQLTQATPSIELPATVQAVLAARIDRLPPGDKHVLQAASVIGKDVSFGLLSVIAELAEVDLRAALARLQAADFLYEARLFPELEYTFKHALTREVAYWGLLQERRRAVHARAMQAIEASAPESWAEHVEQLADHALRSETWDKAYRYQHLAGKKAADRAATRDAIARFEQALVSLSQLPADRTRRQQDVDLRFELRNLLFMRGEFAQVLEHLRVAKSIATELGDRRRLAWANTYLSNSAWQLGDYQSAIEYGQRALATAAQLGDAALQGVATFRLGQAYHGACDYRRAGNLFQQSVAHLQGDLLRERLGVAGTPAIFSRAFAAWSLAELGDFERGLALGEEAIAIAEVDDHPHNMTIACFTVGVLHARRGALESARRRLERALRLSLDQGIATLFPVIASSLAYVNALEGRLSDAQALAERSVDPAALRRATHPSFPFLWAGEAQLLGGQVERALELAHHALDLARRHEEPGHRAYALRLLAEIAQRCRPAALESGEVQYREALTLAADLGMRPLEAQCHLGLGRLLRRGGRFDEAHAELSTAIELLGGLAMMWWLPDAYAELAYAAAARTEQQVN